MAQEKDKGLRFYGPSASATFWFSKNGGELCITLKSINGNKSECMSVIVTSGENLVGGATFADLIDLLKGGSQ